jgi:(E)-4-hydroxy-3-methylbut-2-enyl-diphosphate synthase
MEGSTLVQQPRRQAREVRVGGLVIGGDCPVLIQSMTTADTLDTEAVAAEIAALAAAGCPLVRVTVPHVRAAENLPAIREGMRRRGADVPLVADIHFTPDAAMVAADFVEKVRINPGNYADRKRFAVREYTDREYAAELERIRERFVPLVRKLREKDRALRIGTNHGSLSDRILNRYGDTPIGMVESALEFVRICRELDYHQLVLSMKSSVPSVMIAANRLLARKMADEGMDYPIHLGVTEAGGGLEGRIKSAIGIGVLLTEGIGDTIRVSLTEDSVHEIEACRALLRAAGRQAAGAGAAWRSAGDGPPWEPAAPPGETRRATHTIAIGSLACGGRAPVRVEARLQESPWSADGPGAAIEEARALLRPSDPAAPLAVAELLSIEAPPGARMEAFHPFADAVRAAAATVPLLVEWDLRSPGEIHALEPLLPLVDAIGARVWHERLPLLARLAKRTRKPLRIRVDAEEADRAGETAARCLDEGCEGICFLAIGAGAARRAAAALDAGEGTRGIPIFVELPAGAMDAAIAGGGALTDGCGDAIVLAGRPAEPLRGPDGILPSDPRDVAFAILQGCRLRLTRAEFIACPSCGRTQFDLQSTTRRIQERTAHLRGVKIAIMGCIVNGPGEMADADFGYVGSAPGRVDLYVGRRRVKQTVPEGEAPQRLVELIREHGMWVDPPEPQG